MTDRKCSVSGCDRKHKAKGFCRMHYLRFYRTGTAKKLNPANGDRAGWLRNAIKAAPVEQCIEWPFKKKSGYGRVRFNGRDMAASRAALIIHTGKDPKGLHASHGPCHNPACVNPHHLSWKTPLENQRDRFRDGTASQGEKQGGSKLKTHQIIAIRKDERTHKAIARDYGINKSHVGKIKRRECWAHI